MSIWCKLHLHDFHRIDQVTEENKKDRGAVIETVRETFNIYKCKKCGEEKKKINKTWESHPTVSSKVKDREVIDREWKK